MLAPASHLSAPQPMSPPTPRERQATWGAIFLSLAAFWYGAAVAVEAVWHAFVG